MRKVREAEKEDRQFVSDLMDGALAPFYDGDHRAHASRIFETHLKGGTDKVGHFSKEQKMFILEEDGVRLGMINIVGKRQGTWKISPLIIANDFQGKIGCGSELLDFAERYVREREARQMYCTVAQQNRSALNFFRRKGYIVAGRSESHYKPGVNEAMLYKLFYSNADEERSDQRSISVVPFEEKHREGVYRVILDSDLPTHFRGVDESWVDALFCGYERRETHEVNQKYKLIFVAVERDGTVVGVAGVTPKKGQPVKIMPCTASDPQAFAALITDLPQHLKQFGRKLYLHLVPTVEQVMVLQRMGWSLDAMMPGAYHENYCTQQWGNNMEEITMRTMRVKNNFYQQIMSKLKTIEVRVGYDNIRTISVGETIQLTTNSSSGNIRVRAVRNYNNFRDMLEKENASQIVPGSNKADVLKVLQGIYSPEKERLGVVVLEIEPVK